MNMLSPPIARTARPVAPFTVARFALDGPRLPSVTDTLAVAEQARRALLACCKQLARQAQPGLADADCWPLAPAFWGKDAQGRPRQGHAHAYFLPADEDGDGWVDHLTIYAPMGLGALERQAVDRVRRLPVGPADACPMLLVGLGSERDLRAPLLDEATVWRSATPFLATRYPKCRGTTRDRPEEYATPRAFAMHVLRQEFARLQVLRPELPAVARVDALDFLGSRARLRPHQFVRGRLKHADEGGRRASGAFQITFAGPARGPLCLGHSCHFGLGLFMPEPE